jgi:hypothetical protein
MLSSEATVALAPAAGYRRLLENNTPVPWWRALERPAVVLLIVGVVVPVMALQRVTIGVVATAALSWSFVLAIQSLTGAAVIASVPARSIDATRALDLWFAGHLPFSLWLLVTAGWVAMSASMSMEVLVLSAVVPSVWTAIIVSAFCRTVLGTTRNGGRWRAAGHSMATWGVGLSYIAWAVGGWFRLLGQ